MSSAPWSTLIGTVRGTEGGDPSSVVRTVGSWIALGVAVGVLWRMLTPFAGSLVDNYEIAVAGDVTMATLGMAAGLLAAVRGLIRPGAGAAVRFVVAVVGAGMASLVAWGAGTVLGAPPLTMHVVLLLWPLALAFVTVLASLMGTLLAREAY